jgi:hypothetical protein
MRNGSFLAIAMVATLSLRCGGDDSKAVSHPTLDQDYSSRFAGLWNGSATISVSGQPPETATGSQQIDRVGFNRLSIAEMCTGVAGAAGIDSATSFSTDPLACKPTNATCGPVTVRYDHGTGTLSNGTLTMTIVGSGSGCGQTLPFTLTFTGTLAGAAGRGTGGGTVTLQSDPGDFVGAGRSYAYTSPAAPITATSSAGLLSITISGNENWRGDFQMPSRFSQIVPGTYTGLTRYPFHDAAQGGLDWFGEGRGCNTLTGSMTVDSATYLNALLTTVDLRFEQHCEGAAPALHGQIHWDVNAPAVLPGPIQPPSDGSAQLALIRAISSAAATRSR